MTASDLTRLTDEELVQLARRGPGGAAEEAVVAALLERYRDRIYLWCYRLVRHHEEALDLAQEALVKTYRHLGSFEGRSGFGSWVFSITRNVCLSALRKSRETQAADPDLADLADPASAPDLRFETRVDEEEALELVRRHLDPTEQQALWLRCYEGLPVEEITRLLGLQSASGARGILQRARRKLAAALSDRSQVPGNLPEVP